MIVADDARQAIVIGETSSVEATSSRLTFKLIVHWITSPGRDKKIASPQMTLGENASCGI
jgi:hypothetical protein